jgi:anthranilate phosphoribosyltransferase
MITDAIKHFVSGRSLTTEEASQVMDEIMSGEATPAQVGAFATALRMKGETVDEIVGLAKAMRRRSQHVHTTLSTIDNCGTGGDGAGTFNISTTSAFVVAGTGVPVAKHGGRAVTSRCGSADILEALGMHIQMTPREVEQALTEIGIAFMYAPAFHPAMSNAVKPRREIGIRTVFNLLGPLTNPAGVEAQVVGASDETSAAKLAAALRRLGAKRVMVVHSADGLDELSITGPSYIYECSEYGVSKVTELNPEDAGLQCASRQTILGGSMARNVEILRSVLAGEPGPCRDVVVLNAAAALIVAGRAESFLEGAALAARSIDSGAAETKLRDLVAYSRKSAQSDATNGLGRLN